jgi:two-component system cell cycle response regulator DivK
MNSTHAPRVLVVEDNAMNLELLQTVLEAAGYEVLQATNARAGIELARREQPDVILMDVQLPEVDGLEATRILMADQRTSRLPVVAVSAHVKDEDIARSRAAGCVLHLAKPVDTRALADIIGQVIANANEHSATRIGEGPR